MKRALAYPLVAVVLLTGATALLTERSGPATQPRSSGPAVVVDAPAPSAASVPAANLPAMTPVVAFNEPAPALLPAASAPPALTPQIQPDRSSDFASVRETPGAVSVHKPVTAQPLAGHDVPALATESVAADEPRVAMPLALVPLHASIALDEDQAARLQAVRQQFVTAVGGENQNPDDAGYRARWQQAQPTSDDLFYALFGQEAANAQQIESVHQNKAIPVSTGRCL